MGVWCVLVSDTYREPGNVIRFVSTGKELEDTRDNRLYPSWVVANSIGDKFPNGATMAEIYHDILGPHGLSADDTVHLVKNAAKLGFLKRSR